MYNREYALFLLKKGLFKKSFHLAHHIFRQGGTCLEFGVFRGNSYVYQASEIRKRYPNTQLIGFDSWQGLPDETEGVWYPSVHEKGQYSSTKDVLLDRLAQLGAVTDGERFRLVDGFFEDSLTADLQSQIRDVIFINIDVDIHRSTMELLDFVKPLLRPGVLIYWDDWKSPLEIHDEEWGEHLAWREWQSHNTEIQAETLEVNWVDQRTMIITQTSDSSLSGAELERIRNLNRQIDSLVTKVTKPLVHSSPSRWLIRTGFQSIARMRTPSSGS